MRIASFLTKLAVDDALGIPNKAEYGDVSRLPLEILIPFVIQEHNARRAGKHYDWRFGPQDLYSWATRKDKPTPGDKPIALFQQPLHRGEWANFEGEITRGYGKGTVKTHDKGKILVTKATDNDISFVVAHHKYPEMFKMVRNKHNPKTWLLINTTPTDLQKTLKLPEDVQMEKLKYATIPAEEVDKLFDDKYLVTAKLDGASALYHLLADKIDILSYRTNKDGYPIIHTYRVGGMTNTKIPKDYIGTILKGEVWGERDGKPIHPAELGGLLNATIENSLKAQKEKHIRMRNMLYDVYRKGKKDIVDYQTTPYDERLDYLRELMPHLPQGRFQLPDIANTPEEAKKMWEAIRAGDYPLTSEGIVAFPREGGKPIKAKTVDDYDVYITDYFPGEGKYKGQAAGGFYYSLEPGGPVVGKVGTGFDDKTRKNILEHPEDYIGRVARIRAHEQLPSGAFRAPAFVALHEDKQAAALTDEDYKLYYRRLTGSERVTEDGEQRSYPKTRIVARAKLPDGRDELAGLAELVHWSDPERESIRIFKVRPPYRQKGIGTEMMRRLMELAPQERDIEIVADPFGEGDKLPLDKLMEFYARYGFKADSDADKGHGVSMVRPAIKTAAAYRVDGEKVHGIGLRKTLHGILDEMGVEGLAVNDPITSSVEIMLANQDEEVLNKLRETIKATKGQDLQIQKARKSKLYDVALTEEDMDVLRRLHYDRYRRSSRADNTGAMYPLETYLTGMPERYRLKSDNGLFTGRVTARAKRQLLGEEMPYAYMVNEIVDKEGMPSADDIRRLIQQEKSSNTKLVVKKKKDLKKYPDVEYEKYILRNRGLLGRRVGSAKLLPPESDLVDNPENLMIPDEHWLQEFYVHPKYRNKGHASELMQHILANHLGEQIGLQVMPYGNEPTNVEELESMYRHMGFDYSDPERKEVMLNKNTIKKADYDEIFSREDLCNRCGGCCQANTPFKCSQLRQDDEGKYYYAVYEDRLGPQETASGISITCVKIQQVLEEAGLDVYPECGYVKEIKRKALEDKE